MTTKRTIRICLDIANERILFNVPVEISYRQMRGLFADNYEYIVTFGDGTLRGKISGTGRIERIAIENFKENFEDVYKGILNFRVDR